MPNRVCIFCSQLRRALQNRKLPGTVRHYYNYNPDHKQLQRPQLRFATLLEQSDDAKKAAEEDVDPNALPMSPIMDKEKWEGRYKKPAKPSPPLLHEMSEQSRKLLMNPYGVLPRALAEPIRQDFYFLFRLPRSFLVPITSRVNPETNEPWILPWGIKATDDGPGEPKPKRYALASIDYMKYVSSAPRRWKKARNSLLGIPVDAVWREDMGDFVLKQLRRRVFTELLAAKGGIRAVGDEDSTGMPNEDIGCVLLWRDTESQFAVEQQGSMSEEDNRTDDPSATTITSQNSGTEESDPKLPKSDFPPRMTMEVGGRQTAVYDMNTMLGDELATELKESLAFDEDLKTMAMKFTNQRMPTHRWLLKLSTYLSMDGTT